MASARDAIIRGLNKSKQGRERRMNNFYNSPAYPDKLIRLFNSTFKDRDFGNPPPISKQVKNMLNGFIKICRSNHWPEKRIYETIRDLVIHWDYVKKQDHVTLKEKKRALLGDRPSLMEFLICRETVLTAIERARSMDILEPTVNKSEITHEVKKKRAYAPTEEEMQEEYNKLMEDM